MCDTDCVDFTMALFLYLSTLEVCVESVYDMMREKGVAVPRVYSKSDQF